MNSATHHAQSTEWATELRKPQPEGICIGDAQPQPHHPKWRAKMHTPKET